MYPIVEHKAIETGRASIACFGELLLRFSPDSHGDWIKNHCLPVFIGGAELNVASALALWGSDAEYITALPGNTVGKQLAEAVNHRRVGAGRIQFAEGRAGLYYLPVGGELKSETVIYDRDGSAFALLQPGSLNWQQLLQGINWLHITAISPALNENIAIICKEALSTAKSMGIITSIDLNYRQKLWQYGKQPAEIIPGLAEECDVIMGNVWSAETMLNIPVQLKEEDKKQVEKCVEQAKLTSKKIFELFPNCKLTANTYRFTEGEKVDYYAVLSTRENSYVSKQFSSPQTVDKAGSGDCFMAGLIYSLDNNYSLKEVLDFAAAAAFGKLHIKGDNTTQTVQEIKSLLH